MLTFPFDLNLWFIHFKSEPDLLSKPGIRISRQLLEKSWPMGGFLMIVRFPDKEEPHFISEQPHLRARAGITEENYCAQEKF